jgi:hypothetical protein
MHPQCESSFTQQQLRQPAHMFAQLHHRAHGRLSRRRAQRHAAQYVCLEPSRTFSLLSHTCWFQVRCLSHQLPLKVAVPRSRVFFTPLRVCCRHCINSVSVPFHNIKQVFKMQMPARATGEACRGCHQVAAVTLTTKTSFGINGIYFAKVLSY